MPGSLRLQPGKLVELASYVWTQYHNLHGRKRESTRTTEYGQTLLAQKPTPLLKVAPFSILRTAPAPSAVAITWWDKPAQRISSRQSIAGAGAGVAYTQI